MTNTLIICGKYSSKLDFYEIGKYKLDLFGQSEKSPKIVHIGYFEFEGIADDMVMFCKKEHRKHFGSTSNTLDVMVSTHYVNG